MLQINQVKYAIKILTNIVNGYNGGIQPYSEWANAWSDCPDCW